MLLRNKKTGEILTIGNIIVENPERIDCGELTKCSSLAELNEEWEDYEEPKEYWYIEPDGSTIQNYKPTYINHLLDGLKSIGNYFETKEEAEKAVDKLKAWKRLKDNGFRFLDYTALGAGEIRFEHNVMDEIEDVEQLEKDLDLLFSQEDD